MSDFSTWAARVTDLLARVNSLDAEIRSLVRECPGVGAPDATADETLVLWGRLAGGADLRPSSVGPAARRIGGQMQTALARCTNQLPALVGLAGAVAEQARDPNTELIVTADPSISPAVRRVNFGGEGPVGGQGIAAIDIAALPSGHELRGALPADDCFVSQGKRYILLGEVGGEGAADAWYPRASAMSLTRHTAARQRHEAEQARGQRVREVAEQLEAARSEERAAAARHARIKALEKQLAEAQQG